MPVRTGRVSSRDAERATLADRLDERAASGPRRRVAARLRERREVLGAQRADVERRGAGDELDVLLGSAAARA